MSKELSEIEKSIIDEFAKPKPMAVSELASYLGMNDSANLIYHLKKLVNEGYLDRPRKGVYRTILNEDSKTMAEIPFYGVGQCGPGGKLLQEYPEYNIPLNSQLIKRELKNLFALQAGGQSMTPYIEHGDTVIVEKYKFSDQINPQAIYVVTNNSEVMIKKITTDKTLLLSLNLRFEPIPVDQDSFSVAGRVVSVFKNLDNLFMSDST